MPRPSIVTRGEPLPPRPLATTSDLVKEAMSDPARARMELARSLSAASFHDFVRLAWPVLEPARKFRDGLPQRAICAALQAVTEGKVKRLLINVPPGFSKSILVNVLWPAWEWGPRGLAHHRFISASYEQGLAVRDLIRCRDVITSDWYSALWPMTLKEDQNQKTYYENTRTGWRFAASVGGALTGYRGDRTIVDDPHDVRRAESQVERDIALRWWTETVPTRMNDPDHSAIVLVMQRLHVSDLSGHTISRMDGGDWTKLILPMEFEPARRCVLPEIGFADPREEPGQLLWPEGASRESVEALKRTLMSRGGPYAVAGQLQQRPIPASGGMLKRGAVTFVDRAPADGVTVRGWDLAATKERGAYTAGVKLRLSGGRLYVMDVVRLRGSALEVEDALRAAAEQDGHSCAITIPQDPGQAGKSQKGHLAARLGGYDVHFSVESGDKEDRARPVAAQWQAGNVVLVRAPWNDAFLGEAELFPAADDKDQVDAFSRAYAWLVSHVDPEVSLTPGECF